MTYHRAVCKYEHTSDMTMCMCFKCGNYWATNALRESSITRYCPDCLPVMFPSTLDGPLWGRWADRQDRKVIEDEVRASMKVRVESLEYARDLAEQEQLPFPERYGELRQLGFADWEIAKRLGISNVSLLRYLASYGIDVRPEFASLCHHDRQQREAS